MEIREVWIKNLDLEMAAIREVGGEGGREGGRERKVEDSPRSSIFLSMSQLCPYFHLAFLVLTFPLPPSLPPSPPLPPSQLAVKPWKAVGPRTPSLADSHPSLPPFLPPLFVFHLILFTLPPSLPPSLPLLQLAVKPVEGSGTKNPVIGWLENVMKPSGCFEPGGELRGREGGREGGRDGWDGGGGGREGGEE